MSCQLYRDGKRVLECLQRALRVADACMDTAVSVELFVEILNRYVYYFDQQNETVSLTPGTYKASWRRTHSGLGDDQISERPHRAHTFESANEPGKFELGGSEKALSEDAGLHPE